MLASAVRPEGTVMVQNMTTDNKWAISGFYYSEEWALSETWATKSVNNLTLLYVCDVTSDRLPGQEYEPQVQSTTSTRWLHAWGQI
jgi:hypothetical protein